MLLIEILAKTMFFISHETFVLWCSSEISDTVMTMFDENDEDGWPTHQWRGLDGTWLAPLPRYPAGTGLSDTFIWIVNFLREKRLLYEILFKFNSRFENIIPVLFRLREEHLEGCKRVKWYGSRNCPFWI